MVYRILADAVLILHLAFIIFVVLGGLLALWRPWVAWLHLPAAAWGVAIEFFGWICPLTPLENRLRALGGETGYEGGFIERYLVGLIYPGDLERTGHILLGVAVVILNATVYTVVILRRRRRRRSVAQASRL